MTTEMTGELVSVASRTEADAVADIAERAAEPMEVEAGKLLVSACPQSVTDLGKYAERPRAKKGTVDLSEHASLSRYVNDHKGDGTAIYANVPSRSIEAVLNGHVPNAADPGWGDHRARVGLVHTPNWLFWAAMDRKTMEQITFAHHVEEGLPDIISPAGADLLELATTFEATTSAEFASSHRLQDGQRQLTYKENTTARAGGDGRMEVPETFTLRLAPFEGSDLVDVIARLRYRISGGQLKIAYEIERPETVIREAFATIVAAVTEATGIEPYAGAAPGALR